MAMYEGKWRCTFCGTVCRGREMNCAGCGARRGPDVEFFLDGDAPPVTDEALLREANDGPDWLCETCGGSNRFSVEECQTCGAPLGGSDFRKVTVTPSDAAEAAPEPGETPAHVAASAARVPGRSPNLTPTVLLIIGTGVMALFLLLLGLFGRAGGPPRQAFGLEAAPTPPVLRNVEVAVDRVEWRRSIVIEEYRDVVSEDWEWSVPQDARVISQRQEVHSYDRVKVGSHVVKEHYTERVRAGTRTVTETYTDREQSGTERYQCGTRNRGNGYFEAVYCSRPVYRTVTKTRSKQVDDYRTVSRTRDKVVDDYKNVPVYRPRIKFSVKRWVTADTLRAQGADLKPRWPEVPRARAKTAEGTRREGPRAETYRVFLRDLRTGKVYEREVGGEEFLLFTPGAKCAAAVDGSDRVVGLTPPTRDASP